MTNLALRFWNDERGFIVSAEVVLIMTIGVLGMVVGINSVASSINNEMNDISSAFGALDQSYWYSGLVKVGHSGVSGSAFSDRQDFCDCTTIVRTIPGAKVQGFVPPHIGPPPSIPVPPRVIPTPPRAVPCPPTGHNPHAVPCPNAVPSPHAVMPSVPHHPHRMLHHPPVMSRMPHFAPPENASPVIPHHHGPILHNPCPCPPFTVHPHELKPIPAMPHGKHPKLHVPHHTQPKPPTIAKPRIKK